MEKAVKVGDARKCIANVPNMGLFGHRGSERSAASCSTLLLRRWARKRSVELLMTEEGRVRPASGKAKLDPDTPRRRAQHALWDLLKCCNVPAIVVNRNPTKVGEEKMEKGGVWNPRTPSHAAALAGDFVPRVRSREGKRSRCAASACPLGREPKSRRQKTKDEIDQRVMTSPFIKDGHNESDLEGPAKRRSSGSRHGPDARLLSRVGDVHGAGLDLSHPSDGGRADVVCVGHQDVGCCSRSMEPWRGSDDLNHCKLADDDDEDATGLREG